MIGAELDNLVAEHMFESVAHSFEHHTHIHCSLHIQYYVHQSQDRILRNEIHEEYKEYKLHEDILRSGREESVKDVCVSAHVCVYYHDR